MTTAEKFTALNKHIGWQQVSDTHAVDAELGESPSTGTRLANLLIENAQNQTGISLTEEEHKQLQKDVKSKYC